MAFYDSPPSLSSSPRMHYDTSDDDIAVYSMVDNSQPLYAEPIQDMALNAITHSKSQWPHATSTTSPSFLQDLYDPIHVDDMSSTTSDSPGASAHATYPSPPPNMYRQPHDWAMGGSVHLPEPDPNHSYYRRATYPYVNNDDPHRHHLSHPYGAPVEPHLKMENPSPVIVPTQHILPPPSSYYTQHDSRPSSSHSHTSEGSFMQHQPVMAVMHTDDAASKETQYLRRRCFNCHQTEPPSWRRSTLNPGKIVCNKCGLYERTHMRARPHRFDELRASNKARKSQTTPYPISNGVKTSPKSRQLNGSSFVKKEPHEYPLPQSMRNRRGSSASSVSSNVSGQSDWDESVSVYNSSSSATSSVYSSPIVTPYNIPNPSPSPSFESGNGMAIRLPAVPMAGMTHGDLNLQRSHSPMRSHTAPYYPDRRMDSVDRRYTTVQSGSYDHVGWETGREMEKEPKVALA